MARDTLGERENTMAQFGNTITDIDIPFSRIVAIQLKWMLATIPTLIVMSMLLFLIAALITLITGGGIAGVLELLPKLNMP